MERMNTRPQAQEKPIMKNEPKDLFEYELAAAAKAKDSALFWNALNDYGSEDMAREFSRDADAGDRD